MPPDADKPFVLTKPLHIVLIGAGNVAAHIVDSLTGHPRAQLVQLFNHRHSKPARELANKAAVTLVSAYSKLNTQADLYLICVRDSAIPEVVAALAPLGIRGTVAHTSGSVGIDVLAGVSIHTGVYYPLQTFTRGVAVDWKNTPLLIEGNSVAALRPLKQLAAPVSAKVKTVHSEDRLKLHLAAVFACNFTNALYVAAFDYVSAQLGAKEAELLWPIMNTAFAKVAGNNKPRLAQTGPAMRRDQTVMSRHLKLLKNDKRLAAIYRSLSELIIYQQTRS